MAAVVNRSEYDVGRQCRREPTGRVPGEIALIPNLDLAIEHHPTVDDGDLDQIRVAQHRSSARELSLLKLVVGDCFRKYAEMIVHLLHSG